MALHEGVVGALRARSVVDGILRRVGVVASLVVSLGPEVEGTMLLQLLQTVGAVEESPAQEVEAATELATELLRTLHVCNLLEQLILRVEVGELQTGQIGAGAHLVDPVDGLLSGTVHLVLALGSAQQHVAIAHQAQVDTAVQTGDHLLIDARAEVGVLGDGQTTVVVVGHEEVVGCERLRVSHVAILEAFPVDLVGTDCPVEARVELTLGGALLLEEVVEPGRSRDVGPTTAVARTVVTLDGVALRSVGAGVHGRPLVVGALRAVVEELNLEQALGVVLVGRTLAEVVAVVLHELIVAVVATDDVLQNGECLAVLVALHERAGIEAGGSTAGGTALGPLATLVARRQQRHGLGEVGLHLIHHAVILCEGVLVALFLV